MEYLTPLLSHATTLPAAALLLDLLCDLAVCAAFWFVSGFLVYHAVHRRNQKGGRIVGTYACASLFAGLLYLFSVVAPTTQTTPYFTLKFLVAILLWISALRLLKTSPQLFAAFEMMLKQKRLLRKLAGHRRAERRLRAANSDLQVKRRVAEVANDAKSDLVANISHELRTPLTSILGFSEVLLGNLESPEDLEMVRTIRRNGTYLLELVNDLLDYSKSEAGKLEIEIAPTYPCQVLHDVGSLLRIRAEEKGLPLRFHFRGPIPQVVRTDPKRLRQILINLVGNAVKFTQSGEVVVTTSFVHDNSVSPYLQFEVSDTGIGISPKQLSRLFQPFSQADRATAEHFGGTGLGLVISQQIARSLGGDISVASELGEGSTFTLRIGTGSLNGVPLVENPPIGPDDSEPPTMSSETEVDSAAGLRVLVAEDGPDNQRLITLLLTKMGAEVAVANDGQDAVDMAMQAQADGSPMHLILMDMQMPRLDGYEATRELRRSGYEGYIIAITAHVLETEIQECLLAGCDEVVQKPLEKDSFLKLLDHYRALTLGASPA